MGWGRDLRKGIAADLKGVLPGSIWPVQPPLEGIRWAARMAFPKARIGGGAHGFFTELNRRRPLVHFLDFISFTTTPIVHAADDRSDDRGDWLEPAFAGLYGTQRFGHRASQCVAKRLPCQWGNMNELVLFAGHGCLTLAAPDFRCRLPVIFMMANFRHLQSQQMC
jgi:hypothetical protein